MVACSVSSTASSRASISCDLQARPQQPVAQQAAAHAGAGLIEHVDQRRFLALAGEQRLQQFQIANGDGIQNHGIAAVVKCRAIQMIERRFLRIAQIVQDRAGGRNRQRAAARPQPSSVSRWKCSRRVRSA